MRCGSPVVAALEKLRGGRQKEKERCENFQMGFEGRTLLVYRIRVKITFNIAWCYFLNQL